MKKVREYAYPRLNKNETNNDEVESKLYNGPYKSKSKFLDHIQHCSVDCNNHMICRNHYWLWHFIFASISELYYFRKSTAIYCLFLANKNTHISNIPYILLLLLLYSYHKNEIRNNI